MRQIINLFLTTLLSLLFLSSISPALADRGMIPMSDIAWNEQEVQPCSSHSTPELAFTSLETRCAAGEGSTTTISLRGDKVFFSGYAIASTPCHELEAELVLSTTLQYPQAIVVNISAQEASDAICIQCLGKIPFKGEIRNLEPGEHEIQICYQGSTLAQQRIEIPSEIEPLELLPGTALVVNPGEMLIEVDGIPVELSAPAIEVTIQAHKGHRELRIELEQVFDRVKISANDVSATTGETIGIEDSQLFLESPQGWIPVRIMPDEVLELLLQQEIQSIELNAMDGQALFAIQGIAKAKLLGLFPIGMRVKTTVSALSGEIIEEEMPWWRLFCDLPQRGISQ